MMNTVNRRTFLGMAGLLGAGLYLGFPQQAEAATQTRVLLGTFVSVSLAGVSEMQSSEALERAFAEISRLDGILSRHNPATPLSELNRSGKITNFPQELRYVLESALLCGQQTQGAFDVTIQPLLDLYQSHSNPRGRMRIPEKEIQAARALLGPEHIHLDDRKIPLDRAGMGLTLDGIAKGYIADRASAVLCECGVRNHLINAGGDIVAMGEKESGHSWRVGIPNPGAPAVFADTLTLRGGAIATSGSYENYYDAARDHHHLISPFDGDSPANVGSVSVLAPSAMEADSLATALSILTPQQALTVISAMPGRECLILRASGQKYASPGWV